MAKGKLSTMRMDDIRPYPNNPRKNDGAVDAVAESIRQCGYVAPIIVDEDGVILAGHTRYKALKKLGYETADVLIKSGMTEEQKKKYRLLDNKTGELADWDYDLLEMELDGLDFGSLDLDWGIDMEEAPEVAEDNYEVAPPEEPKSKPGDIYQLGRHRLMCGDSTSIDAVETLMGGQMADMVFTDPPYGYNYQSNMREKTKRFDVLENDDKILDFFPNVRLVCNGFVFICTTWKVLDKWIPLFKKYHDLTNMIIWDKGGGGIGDLKHTFSTDYEVILCSNNGKEIKGKRIGSVWNIQKDSATEYTHPTQKPVKLSEFAIRNTTERGAVVLDLFGGSGSTLIACEQLDRICYMMELDPKYCDVILQRYINLTGTSEDVYRINADGTKTKYADLT